MKTQQFQLTLYLPEDQTRPAVAAPLRRDDVPSTKALSIREAAHQYTCQIKDLPVADQPTRAPALRTGACAGVSRLQHYGCGALNTSELLTIVMGAQYVADADHILGETEGLPGLAAMTFAELTSLPAVFDLLRTKVPI